MKNFQVCSFAFDDYHYVIKINSKINPGKMDSIQFLWIKYEHRARFIRKNEIEIAPMLIFQEVDKETLENIANILEIELSKHNLKSITLSEIINNLADLFKKIRQKNLKKTYIGLLSEMLFIWKNQEKQIDLKKYYQKNLYDQFDFKINKQTVEIKTLNTFKNTIKLNKKQLLNFLKTNVQIFVCEFYFDSFGSNLEDLFNLIENNLQLKAVWEKIVFIKKNASHIFDEIKVNLEKSKIKKFDKNKINYKNIEFLEQNFVVNINIEINFINDEEVNVFKHIKEYIDGRV